MQADSMLPGASEQEKGQQAVGDQQQMDANGNFLNPGSLVPVERSPEGHQATPTPRSQTDAITSGIEAGQGGQGLEVHGSSHTGEGKNEDMKGTAQQEHWEGTGQERLTEREGNGQAYDSRGGHEGHEGFDGGDGDHEHRSEVPLSERKKKKRLEVFVGGLDKEATEEDLREVFETVGEVSEVRLSRDPESGRNKGFAFIRYATSTGAARAAAELEFVEVRGKKVGVLPSEENDTLFVGNINKSWAKEDVLVTLSNYGILGVEEVALMEDPQHDGMNRGFAFVEFNGHKDALDAWRKLQTPDATFGLDRSAKVAWAQPLNEPDEHVMAQVKSVFVDGMPPLWNEDRVKDYFARFGEIERVVLAKNMHAAKRKDFGFVNYAKREAALAAIEALHNTEILDDGFKIRMKVTLAKPQSKGRPIKGGVRGGYPARGDTGRVSRGGYDSRDRWGGRFDPVVPSRGGKGGPWDPRDRGGRDRDRDRDRERERDYEVEDEKASISSLLRVLREQAEKEVRGSSSKETSSKGASLRTLREQVEKEVRGSRSKETSSRGASANTKPMEKPSEAKKEEGQDPAQAGPAQQSTTPASVVAGDVQAEVETEPEAPDQVALSEEGTDVASAGQAEGVTPGKAAAEKPPADKYECNMCGFGSDIEEEYEKHKETKVHKLIEDLRKDEKLTNKTPLSILHEFASRNKAEVTFETRGETNLGPFELVVNISGLTGIPDVETVGIGRQKTKAKQTAAANALETLMKVVPESEFTKPGQSRLKSDRRLADARAGRSGSRDSRDDRGSDRGDRYSGSSYEHRRDRETLTGGYQGRYGGRDDREGDRDWRGRGGSYSSPGSAYDDRGYSSRYGAGGLKYGGLKYALPREREETYAERLERIQGRGYAMRLVAAATPVATSPLSYQDGGRLAGALPSAYHDRGQLAAPGPVSYQERDQRAGAGFADRGELAGAGAPPPGFQERGQLAGGPPPAFQERHAGAPPAFFQDRGQPVGGPPPTNQDRALASPFSSTRPPMPAGPPSVTPERGQPGGVKRPYGPGMSEPAQHGDFRGAPRPKLEGPGGPPPGAAGSPHGPPQNPSSRPPHVGTGPPPLPSGSPLMPPSSAPAYVAPAAPAPAPGGYPSAFSPSSFVGSRMPQSSAEAYSGAPAGGPGVGPYPPLPPTQPPHGQLPTEQPAGGYTPGAYGGSMGMPHMGYY